MSDPATPSRGSDAIVGDLTSFKVFSYPMGKGSTGNADQVERIIEILI
jgi:hypothetical protein